jgi:TRAP-type uncharacterized transport system substrate-binding protein
VAGLYPEVCQIVAKSDIKDIHDLKGRKVSIGDEGNGTELNAVQILSAYGMSETDIDADHLSFGASVAVLATLVTGDRISADDVFVITKLLFENKDNIAAICEEGNDLDLESAVNSIPIPLHAGAEKFYFGK